MQHDLILHCINLISDPAALVKVHKRCCFWFPATHNRRSWLMHARRKSLAQADVERGAQTLDVKLPSLLCMPVLCAAASACKRLQHLAMTSKQDDGEGACMGASISTCGAFCTRSC